MLKIIGCSLFWVVSVSDPLPNPLVSGTLLFMWKKLKALFMEQLTQGVSPQSLALSCAVTIAIAAFPIAGTTWIILGVLAFALKLNQPLVQGLNQLLTPYWLLMLPVNLRIGEWLVGATPVSINPTVILEQASTNWRVALSHYGMAGLYASLAWVFIGPTIGVVVYLIAKPTFENVHKRFNIPNNLPEGDEG
jgi:uncharacterized protein (DUF2062 family)